MSLSRKRQKELRQLQSEAAKLWAAQQVVVGEAANVAREAGRQLDNFRREQLVPTVQDVYEHRVVPAVDKGVKFSRDIVDHKVVPAIGGVVGSALTAWDIANAKRTGTTHAPRALVTVPAERKSGPGIGAVIAIILGAAAAVSVLVAAWQALRADDELWVADDPLNAPEV
ncbi:DNA helicase [Microbacterium sp. MMO-10]|uniref:DNA helicase n=1 Tax=Microbacterium sp. MMO-10 TaxID=3081272 RepID=UPI003016D800